MVKEYEEKREDQEKQLKKVGVTCPSNCHVFKPFSRV